MKGPFYQKGENGTLRLFKSCKDCAFLDYEEDEIDAACIMQSCPCMPPDDGSEEDEDA